MSVPRWRRSVISIWVTLAALGLLIVGTTTRNVSLFLAAGLVPPLMLLWLWNNERPLMLGSLSSRKRR